MRLSPFPGGAARPRQYLFGRDEELEALERFARQVQTWQHPDVMCIIAPAGLGKTCLLKLLGRQLRDQGWFCGYSEASADATSSVIDLISDASEALPPAGPGARFRARLEEFSVTAGPVGVGLKLGAAADLTPYSRLTSVLRSLGRLAAQDNVGVALLIDEAQALSRTDLELLLRVIARLDDLPIALLLAGLPKIPRRLVLGDDDGSRTLQEIWYHPLKPLTGEQARGALTGPIADAGGRIDDDALTLLAGFSAGHPLGVQMLGSAAWNAADRAARGGALAIAVPHAAAAVDSVRAQLAVSVYEPVWSGCTKTERRTLRVLAEYERQPVIEHDFPAPYGPLYAQSVEVPGLDPYEVDAALARFAGNGLIYRGDSSRPMGFVVPGFCDFVRSARPRR